MLDFLFPLQLFWLLGLSLPLAIHLFGRKKGRIVQVGSLRHLQAGGLARRKSLQIFEWLLLMIRMAFWALLCVWLSGPRLYLKSVPNERGWILLDPQIGPHGLPPEQRTLFDALKARGLAVRQLAPGFPSFGEVPSVPGETIESVNIWALLLQADQILQPGAELHLFTPGYRSSFEGKRPQLSRPIDWHTLPAATQTSDFRFWRLSGKVFSQQVQSRGDRTHFLFAPQSNGPGEGAGDRLQYCLRYSEEQKDEAALIRGALQSWAENQQFPITEVFAPTTLRAGDFLFWLERKALPPDVQDWVLQGGIVVRLQDLVSVPRAQKVGVLESRQAQKVGVLESLESRQAQKVGVLESLESRQAQKVGVPQSPATENKRPEKVGVPDFLPDFPPDSRDAANARKVGVPDSLPDSLPDSPEKVGVPDLPPDLPPEKVGVPDLLDSGGPVLTERGVLETWQTGPTLTDGEPLWVNGYGEAVLSIQIPAVAPVQDVAPGAEFKAGSTEIESIILPAAGDRLLGSRLQGHGFILTYAGRFDSAWSALGQVERLSTFIALLAEARLWLPNKLDRRVMFDPECLPRVQPRLNQKVTQTFDLRPILGWVLLLIFLAERLLSAWGRP